MKTELERCLSGEYYNCHDEVFLAFKAKTKGLLLEYNQLSYDAKIKKRAILEQMLERIGENVSIGAPFICDYGQNISIGDNVSINMNCTFIDCNKITIDNKVLIASNVQIYTSTHPVETAERFTPDWKYGDKEYFCRTYAKPVRIEDEVWIGGGVIILPGITIGRGSVIGAGSVVTKDVPANVVAAGNPARIIRNINQDSERH